MAEVCIYVIGHRPFRKPDAEGYESIQVGDGEPFALLRDNTGDNISHKNQLYCELTGLYWGWKNHSDAEILGLVHYRRYFIRRSMTSRSFQQDLLLQEDILGILNSHDVIIQAPSLKNPVTSNMLYEGMREEEQNLSLMVLREIIGRRYPEDLRAFDAVAFGYRLCHGNMFITRREVFLSYCAWLFSILEAYESAFAALGEEIEPRQCGYLGEYLLTVFMHSRIEKQRIWYCPSAMFTCEENDITTSAYQVKNILRFLGGPAIDRVRNRRAIRSFEHKRRMRGLPYDQEIMNGRKYQL